MAFRYPTREDDDTVLQWLEMRESAVSTGQIAKMFNTTPARVRTVTNRIYSEEKEAN